jgi:hypothetical protein
MDMGKFGVVVLATDSKVARVVVQRAAWVVCRFGGDYRVGRTSGNAAQLDEEPGETCPAGLGSLALLLWGMLYLVAAEMQDYLPSEILKWLLAWVVMPVIFFPFAAASNLWGCRLPWRSILRVVCAWRWWLCVLLTATVGRVAEIYFDSICGNPHLWDVDLAAGLNMGAVDLLETGLWVLLLGSLAVLFDMGQLNSGPNVAVMTTCPAVPNRLV